MSSATGLLIFCFIVLSFFSSLVASGSSFTMSVFRSLLWRLHKKLLNSRNLLVLPLRNSVRLLMTPLPLVKMGLKI